ncbi:hypothetical protein [Mucilaginibacter sp.]|uniref:hypothetical protein n=1 Tax=Mucilaginibacter sp. TaxID=1882438 RepID=UPI0032669667
MEYSQISFYTLTGVKKAINLGDFAHGEWVVYEFNKPKYYINLFSKLEADALVHSILNKREITIDVILQRISKNEGIGLTLGRIPFVNIIKKVELVNLELPPLPLTWLKKL